MNCTTYREDTLNFLKSVAAKKIERMQMTEVLHDGVKTCLNDFHAKQLKVKHDQMKESADLREELQQANSYRLAKSRTFFKQLNKEGQERQKDRMQMSINVENMLASFDEHQQKLKIELEHLAKSLHTKLKHEEKTRLSEFKVFEKLLSHERDERIAQTNNLIMKTQRYLNECRQHQNHTATEIQDQFAQTEKARHEIQMAWAALASGHVSDLVTSKGTAVHKVPMSEPRNHKAEHDHQPEQEETDSNAQQTMDDLKMKMKAVISGFHEGCKFAELHRALGEISKSAARDALNQLLAAKEIRKDHNEKFHLI